ncbi:MAG: CinA family protein [Chloroflexi bacterium]|nr:CinA family protein [Chloroflexota bacterium]
MDCPLEQTIGPLLRARELKLATAESCTGGLVAHRVTNIPGSSEYFLGGVVAYDNQVKMDVLNVPAGLLAQYGAVSEETVRAMAEGARGLTGADVAVSVSGVAGPGGGSPEKPVGATWIGLAAPDGTWARYFCWEGDREQNKALSAEAALQFVLDYLEGKLPGK